MRSAVKIQNKNNNTVESGFVSVCVCVCVLVDVYAYVCRGQNNGKKAQLQTGWPTGPYRDAGACCDSDGRLSVTTRASAFRFCLACPSGVYRLVFAAHYERRLAWNRRLSTRQGYSKQTSLQTPETRCDPTEASPSPFSRLGLVFFSFNTASRELFCSIFNRSEILARVWNVGPGRPFFFAPVWQRHSSNFTGSNSVLTALSNQTSLVVLMSFCYQLSRLELGFSEVRCLVSG